MAWCLDCKYRSVIPFVLQTRYFCRCSLLQAVTRSTITTLEMLTKGSIAPYLCIAALLACKEVCVPAHTDTRPLGRPNGELEAHSYRALLAAQVLGRLAGELLDDSRGCL